jgi:hypothetical protein
MSLAELIRLLEVKITTLNVAQATASTNGDVKQVILIGDDIIKTQITLDQLKTLVT